MSKHLEITGVASPPGMQPNVARALDSRLTSSSRIKSSSPFMSRQSVRSIFIARGTDVRQGADPTRPSDRSQESKEDLVDSHFQIGGIHGLPYGTSSFFSVRLQDEYFFNLVRWDGAGPEQPAAAPAGYSGCQHITTIFATWHRPYCALYEVSFSIAICAKPSALTLCIASLSKPSTDMQRYRRRVQGRLQRFEKRFHQSPSSLLGLGPSSSPAQAVLPP